MKNTLLLITSLLFITFGSPYKATAQTPLTEINFAHIYNPNTSYILDYQVASSENEYKLFLRLDIKIQNQLLSNFQIFFGFKDSYTDTEITDYKQVDLADAKITGERNIHYLGIDFENTEKNSILILRIIQTQGQKEFLHVIKLRNNEKSLYTGILPFEKDREVPLFRNYVNGEEEFRIKQLFGSSEEIAFIHYPETFLAAEPPLVTQSTRFSPELRQDSSFVKREGQVIRLTGQGFYFIQADSTTNEGISIVLTDRFFPKAALIDDVIEPFVYLSSSTEYEQLMTAENQKIGLDEHLVKISRSQERSKTIVKDYFRNVARANALFTNYKYGWKTDKGLIYSIYGNPDEVMLINDSEEWNYLNRAGIPRLRFTFTRIDNIFSPEHYVLMRDRNYAEFWFRSIDSWRTGRQGQ